MLLKIINTVYFNSLDAHLSHEMHCKVERRALSLAKRRMAYFNIQYIHIDTFTINNKYLPLVLLKEGNIYGTKYRYIFRKLKE